MACSRSTKEFSYTELRSYKDTYRDNRELLDEFKVQLSRVEYSLKLKDITWEYYQAFLHLLSRAVSCETQKETVIRILNSIKDSTFLSQEGVRLFRDEQMIEVKDLIEVLLYIEIILQQILLRMPSSFITLMGLIEVVTMVATKRNLCASESEAKELKEIISSFTAMKIYLLQGIQQTEKRLSKPLTVEEPPDNFRNIPIMPDISDVFPSEIVFLRANIARGSYNSLQHYLDIQFRLYREDCVSPLREGIADYRHQVSSRNGVGRLQDVRLYKNVKVTAKEMSLDGEVHTIQLDRRHSKTIQWAQTKRLLYGSLVCFSNDNFETLLFGIVSDSDRKILQHDGTFKVQFADNRAIQFAKSMHMVETTAYFEAYRHVLKSLKEIQEGQLPFEPYIVYCQREVSPPAYLIGEEAKCYDFTPLVEDTKINLSDREEESWRFRVKTPVLSPNKWPTAEELKLNESQFDAFELALTKEFVLIQGPPGTGKTHLGIKIAKCLLHNRHVWNRETINAQDYRVTPRNSPLLIVCFTNHALDQFVEGIISCLDSRTTGLAKGKIIRVGGRCQNEEIEKLSLKHLRGDRDGRQLYYEMKVLHETISELKWKLKMSYERILNESILSKVVGERFVNCFKSKQIKDGKRTRRVSILLRWLGVTVIDLLKQNYQRVDHSCAKWDDEPMEENDLDMPNDENDDKSDMIDIETEADRIKHDRDVEQEILTLSAIPLVDIDFGTDVNRQLHIYMSRKKIKLDSKANADVAKKVKEIQSWLKSSNCMTGSEVRDLKEEDIWRLNKLNRWRLYRYWVNIFRNKVRREIEESENQYLRISDYYKASRQNEDSRILSNATVIAMTTTGAARYQDILRRVGPKITIIEEAAEVLEAHIITSLVPKCEHLILIGDHKQLEPKPAVYELAVKYNLALSMFERMIRNGLEYNCLQKQHRMRPEIAKLLRHIYPKLINNDNVKHYEHIRGMKKDVYFIDHEHQEEYADESLSYSNTYEAEYIVRLCRYLLQQGYEESSIAVLTAYAGQMFCIQKLMPKAEFGAVRLTVVDNYQGEENDIILLSLVRSNSLGDTGFLKRENRICVALSRAKKGFYVIGNFRTMRHSSDMWKKIISDLQIDNAIGRGLPLQCANHPENEGVIIKELDDFKNVPEGGCLLKCEARLSCGHACRLKCHPYDFDHKLYTCNQLCRQKCKLGHICNRTCHHDTPCNCLTIVMKQLVCGHTINMECSEEPNETSCTELVLRELLCGHDEIMKCWENPVNWKCTVKVKKKLRCGHIAEIKCSEDPKDYTGCKQLVNKTLLCGHKVTMACNKDVSSYTCKVDIAITFPECNHKTNIKCFQQKSFLDENECMEQVQKIWPCGHRDTMACCLVETVACHFDCMKTCVNGHVCKDACHFPNECICKVEIEKTIPKCGHVQAAECYLNPEEVVCKQIVQKTLHCGHKKDLMCFENPNTVICKIEVLKKLQCGHSQNAECHMPNNAIKCETIVKKKLPHCGHKLMMSCHETPTNQIACKKMVPKELPMCGHTLMMPCHEKPLDQTCEKPIELVNPACGHKYFKRCCDTTYIFGSFEENSTTEEDLLPKCTAMTDITCQFGHVSSIQCSDRETLMCMKKCEVILLCGHKCQGSCNVCIGGNIHKPCGEKCNKKYLCSHRCENVCGKNIPCENKCAEYYIRHPVAEVNTCMCYITEFQNYIDGACRCPRCRKSRDTESRKVSTDRILKYLQGVITENTISKQQIRDINMTLIRLSMKRQILACILNVSEESDQCNTDSNTTDNSGVCLLEKISKWTEKYKMQMDQKLERKTLPGESEFDQQIVTRTDMYVGLLDYAIHCMEQQILKDAKAGTNVHYQKLKDHVSTVLNTMHEGAIPDVPRVPLLQDTVDLNDSDLNTCENGHVWNRDIQAQVCTESCKKKLQSKGTKGVKEGSENKNRGQDRDTEKENTSVLKDETENAQEIQSQRIQQPKQYQTSRKKQKIKYHTVDLHTNIQGKSSSMVKIDDGSEWPSLPCSNEGRSKSSSGISRSGQGNVSKSTKSSLQQIGTNIIGDHLVMQETFPQAAKTKTEFGFRSKQRECSEPSVERMKTPPERTKTPIERTKKPNESAKTPNKITKLPHKRTEFQLRQEDDDWPVLGHAQVEQKVYCLSFNSDTKSTQQDCPETSNERTKTPTDRIKNTHERTDFHFRQEADDWPVLGHAQLRQKVYPVDSSCHEQTVDEQTIKQECLNGGKTSFDEICTAPGEKMDRDFSKTRTTSGKMSTNQETATGSKKRNKGTRQRQTQKTLNLGDWFNFDSSKRK